MRERADNGQKRWVDDLRFLALQMPEQAFDLGFQHGRGMPRCHGYTT